MAYPYYPTYPQYAPQERPQMPPQMMPQQPVMQQPPAPAPRPGMYVQPVAGLEEARAVQTDFSGATAIMPDFAHGMIYTKHLDTNTGASVFCAYAKQDIHAAPQTAQGAPVIDPTQFVLRKDFDVLAAKFNALLDRLGESGGKQNDE